MVLVLVYFIPAMCALCEGLPRENVAIESVFSIQMGVIKFLDLHKTPSLGISLKCTFIHLNMYVRVYIHIHTCTHIYCYVQMYMST